ncbi:MAG: TatD family hydrolase [Acidimicrobiales bacterium]
MSKEPGSPAPGRPDEINSELSFSWTDTHCHLQYAPDRDEQDAVLRRGAEAGTRTMICVGTDEASSREAVALARRCSGGPVAVYATVGLHPHDADAGTTAIAACLSELRGSSAHQSLVVGVGECGLDYHYDHSPRAVQRKAFAAQVHLAHDHGLALVVHTREAFDDTLAILGTEGVPDRTVFHCFTGGPSDAEACLRIGAYLSFSGIVTFNNAGQVREAVRLCPLDKVLVETDSPFLTPVPHRGKTNEPGYVRLVGEAIAREKDLAPEQVARATSKNAVAAFRLGTS